MAKHKQGDRQGKTDDLGFYAIFSLCHFTLEDKIINKTKSCKAITVSNLLLAIWIMLMFHSVNEQLYDYIMINFKKQKVCFFRQHFQSVIKVKTHPC